MASPLTPILLWVLAMITVWLIGFVMGRWSAIAIYIEAVRGLTIIARFDRHVYGRAAARWLRRQNTDPPDDYLAVDAGPVTDRAAAAWRWLVQPHSRLTAALRLKQPLAPQPTPATEIGTAHV